jgi:hypothetical protein
VTVKECHRSRREHLQQRAWTEIKTTMATVEIDGRTTGTLTVDERDDSPPTLNTCWHNLVHDQR